MLNGMIKSLNKNQRSRNDLHLLFPTSGASKWLSSTDGKAHVRAELCALCPSSSQPSPVNTANTHHKTGGNGGRSNTSWWAPWSRRGANYEGLDSGKVVLAQGIGWVRESESNPVRGRVHHILCSYCSYFWKRYCRHLYKGWERKI